MSNLKYLSLPLAAAGMVFAIPAMAQGDDQTSSFNGPYVSGSFGMAAQGADHRERLVFDANGDGKYADGEVTTPSGANALIPYNQGLCDGVARGPVRADGCRKDNDNIEYSGRIGYDKTMGHLVVGGLFEVDKSNSTDGATTYSIGPNAYSIQRKQKFGLAIRARAGYTPNGRILFYGTGGVTYGKIHHAFYTTDPTRSFISRNNNDMHWGWQAGGGAEAMVTKHIGVGLEYLYNRYHDDNYFVQVSQAPAPSAANPGPGVGTRFKMSDGDYDWHSIRATLSYHF
jgi:outer membrane immunogenic protein